MFLHVLLLFSCSSVTGLLLMSHDREFMWWSMQAVVDCCFFDESWSFKCFIQQLSSLYESLSHCLHMFDVSPLLLFAFHVFFFLIIFFKFSFV